LFPGFLIYKLNNPKNLQLCKEEIQAGKAIPVDKVTSAVTVIITEHSADTGKK
jgi:hypothetical protein